MMTITFNQDGIITTPEENEEMLLNAICASGIDPDGTMFVSESEDELFLIKCINCDSSEIIFKVDEATLTTLKTVMEKRQEDK